MLPDNRSFRWFLQTAMPGIKLQHICSSQLQAYRLVAPENNMYIEFVQDGDDPNWRASLHADSGTNYIFLNSMFSVYEQWNELGQPSVEDYHVSLSEMPTGCATRCTFL
jgi:hypothetical protein